MTVTRSGPWSVAAPLLWSPVLHRLCRYFAPWKSTTRESHRKSDHPHTEPISCHLPCRRSTCHKVWDAANRRFPPKDIERGSVNELKYFLSSIKEIHRSNYLAIHQFRQITPLLILVPVQSRRTTSVDWLSVRAHPVPVAKVRIREVNQCTGIIVKWTGHDIHYAIGVLAALFRLNVKAKSWRAVSDRWTAADTNNELFTRCRMVEVSNFFSTEFIAWVLHLAKNTCQSD